MRRPGPGTLIILSLVSLATAGAQRPAAPRPAVPESIDSMSLDSTMRYIQDTLNAQGRVSFQATGTYIPSPPNKPMRMVSETSFLVSDAMADAGRCALSLHYVDESREEGGLYSKEESTVKVALQDVETLEIQSVIDGYKTGVERNTRWEVFPPTFILHILLKSGKTYESHTRETDEKGEVTVTDGVMRGGFWLYFVEEGGARQMAEAIEHASDLCAAPK